MDVEQVEEKYSPPHLGGYSISGPVTVDAAKAQAFVNKELFKIMGMDDPDAQDLAMDNVYSKLFDMGYSEQEAVQMVDDALYKYDTNSISMSASALRAGGTLNKRRYSRRRRR